MEEVEKREASPGQKVETSTYVPGGQNYSSSTKAREKTFQREGEAQRGDREASLLTNWKRPREVPRRGEEDVEEVKEKGEVERQSPLKQNN